MCFAFNKKLMSEGSKIKLKDESDTGLANQSSDKIPASKCFKHNTQVGVGGKLPDAGENQRGYKMSYNYQKDLEEVVAKAVKKYGSMEKAIFEMNGHILDLSTTLDGVRALHDSEE